jgi:ribosomal protein S18 acetylase RimI-like enzyme
MQTEQGHPGTEDFELRFGLPDELRAEAARLYWLAFGNKLGRVLGPEARALRYLDAALRSDHAVVALDHRDRLLGIAGFKSPEGSFAGGTVHDMQGAYGVFGAAWRAWLLSRLSREVDNRRFLIDGICVAPFARNHGVGTALIGALCGEARRRGYPEVRLEVIDSNRRARALYERLGFRVLKTERIGLLAHVFGFRAATTMILPLEQDG